MKTLIAAAAVGLIALGNATPASAAMAARGSACVGNGALRAAYTPGAAQRCTRLLSTTTMPHAAPVRRT